MSQLESSQGPFSHELSVITARPARYLWFKLSKCGTAGNLKYSVRLGQVRLGQVRLGQGQGQVRIGQGQVRQVRLGQVRVRLGQVRLGSGNSHSVLAIFRTGTKVVSVLDTSTGTKSSTETFLKFSTDSEFSLVSVLAKVSEFTKIWSF